MKSSLIQQAFEATWTDIVTSEVPLEHWTESVFRFFFVRQLLKNKSVPECNVQSEWHQIDLIVKDDAKWYPIEFKFYIQRMMYDFRNQVIRDKGGPSKKNRAEFDESIVRLRSVRREPWYRLHNCVFDVGYVVLFHADSLDPVDGRKPFSHLYDDIGNHAWTVPPIRKETIVSDKKAICHLVEVELDEEC